MLLFLILQLTFYTESIWNICLFSSNKFLPYIDKFAKFTSRLYLSLKARDVAERPGDVRLRRPERSGDIRTVRTRQGSNIEKRAIHRMTLFSISLRARDGIRTRDPRLGKAILHHWATRAHIPSKPHIEIIFTVSSTNQTFLDKPSTD